MDTHASERYTPPDFSGGAPFLFTMYYYNTLACIKGDNYVVIGEAVAYNGRYYAWVRRWDRLGQNLRINQFRAQREHDIRLNVFIISIPEFEYIFEYETVAIVGDRTQQTAPRLGRLNAYIHYPPVYPQYADSSISSPESSFDVPVKSVWEKNMVRNNNNNKLFYRYYCKGHMIKKVGEQNGEFL